MFYRCYSEVDKTSCKHEALASTGSHWKCGRSDEINSHMCKTYESSKQNINWKKTNNPIVNNSQSQQKWHKDHKASRLLMLVAGYSCDQLTGSVWLQRSMRYTSAFLFHITIWSPSPSPMLLRKLSFWVPVMVPTNTCVKQQAPGHSYSSYRIIYHLQIRIGAPSLPRHHGEVVSPDGQLLTSNANAALRMSWRVASGNEMRT